MHRSPISRSLAAALLVLSGMTQASAQQLATPFNGNVVATSQPSIQFFDVTAHRAVRITDLDINMRPDGPGPTGFPLATQATLSVYVRPGTFVGNTAGNGGSGSPGWTLAGTITQTNLPGPNGGSTSFTLPGPLDLVPGRWAFALEADIPFIVTPGTSVGVTAASTPELTLYEGALQEPTTGTLSGGVIFNAAINYQSLPGFAAANTFGEGCGAFADFASIYEEFPTAAIDFSGSAGTETVSRFTFIGSGYVGINGTPAWHTPTAGATSLGANAFDEITLPFSFAFPGGTTDKIWIVPEAGVIALEDPNNYPQWFATFPQRLSEMLLDGPAALSPLGAVYGLGGSITYEADPAGTAAYITFDAVPQPLVAQSISTFQCALFANGDFEFRYRELAPTLLFAPPLYPTVGVFSGNGALDPGSTDITAAYPFTLQPDVSVGAVALTADRPVEGTSIQLTVDNINPNARLGLLVFSATQVLPGVPAIRNGDPACLRYVGLDSSVAFSATSQTVSIPAQIPVGSLTGSLVYAQAAVFTPTVQGPTVTTSNGLELLIDVR